MLRWVLDSGAANPHAIQLTAVFSVKSGALSPTCSSRRDVSRNYTAQSMAIMPLHLLHEHKHAWALNLSLQTDLQAADLCR